MPGRILVAAAPAQGRRLRAQLEGTYALAEAGGCAEAAALLQGAPWRYSAVVADAGLPEQDGAALRLLRSEAASAALPLLLIADESDTAPPMDGAPLDPCPLAWLQARLEAAVNRSEQAGLLGLLAETGRALPLSPDVGSGIRSLLRLCLNYFHADRASLLELDQGRQSAVGTYTVSTEETGEAGGAVLKAALEDWLRAFDRQGYAAQAAPAPLLAFPVNLDGQCKAVLRLDGPERPLSAPERFGLLGDQLAGLLVCRRLFSTERGGGGAVPADQLRLREEEYRLAVRHSNNVVCRYDVAARTLTLPQEAGLSFADGETALDVPYGQVREGKVSPQTAGAYIDFYERIRRGEKDGEMVYQRRTPQGWRWMEARFSTIFDGRGCPVTAVVSFADVTDRQEKEAVYRKWQQSLLDRDPATYTLFRANVSKNTAFDSVEGQLLPVAYPPELDSFDRQVAYYTSRLVDPADRDWYPDRLRSDALLAGYYRGKRNDRFDYRELLPEGGSRWLRCTAELVEYPNSSDVEAYLLYENIDAEKREELATQERAETDPLTGVLNRSAFGQRVNDLLRDGGPGSQSALLMLDLDGFKQVNDVFGHGAGDQTLLDTADTLRSVLRRGDLLGRLGGDEFLIFLSGIPDDGVAAARAGQLCGLLRRSFSQAVRITCSVGVASAPRDGGDFQTLYEKADAALYAVKDGGRDDFAFYQAGMERRRSPAEVPGQPDGQPEKLRRLLVVDDNAADRTLLAGIFRGVFQVETASDGSEALARLRHFGTAVSAVVLDLMMPGMNGFDLLEAVRRSAALGSIPVVAVSGDVEPETCLRAIEAGAADFITKPVDAALLRIRVQAAIGKADNARLRVKSSWLEQQGDAEARHSAVLEAAGVAVIEHDWVGGSFRYTPSVSKYLAGRYDDRRLWRILLSDLVAETVTVQQMQALVHRVAEDRKRMYGSLLVRLKTPDQSVHRFRMSVSKETDAYQLTSKLRIVLIDLDYLESD